MGYVDSEYRTVMGSISETLGDVNCIFLHLQEDDALWKYNIGYFSRYLRSRNLALEYSIGYLSKILHVVDCIFLLLQEADALRKWNIRIQVQWVIHHLISIIYISFIPFRQKHLNLNKEVSLKICYSFLYYFYYRKPNNIYILHISTKNISIDNDSRFRGND